LHFRKITGRLYREPKFIPVPLGVEGRILGDFRRRKYFP
jgi:hypothetical protein